ncbi:TRAP transporter large permease subunit [Lutimaribacter saemankumensis]|uniref:TRAP transporter, DctM subunit n=1 Tax=Lutimaribacter saemankumensis TaxID=490829 RepID=A0A1G8J993_9RHOB|nr:TRAP transporter large permease subunit [Lutimaribacter saemankumensis]SDI27633.1 TRAP transporter, DctM subunit [Lutimaribacter saemankumensis]
MELFFLIVLILLMATALGSGYPVAFALPGAAILAIGLAAGAGYIFGGNPDAYFHTGGPSEWLSAGVLNLRGVYWEVERDTLIAIPLFIFMGLMLQRSKIAEDLLVTMAQLFGPVPGGLGISVVFVGALLAATTGIVGATVVAMGLISLPAMLRNNYSAPLATGTISASGTLGQIIPPSIVLIILADQLASATDQASTARKALHKAATGEISMPSEFDVGSTSAGEMFLGAFVPGMVLVGLYMAYILIFAILRPKSAPAVPYEGKYDGKFWVTVALTLVPPLALIFLVLGSIIAGIATVNQAGAVGAAGALIMAGYRLHSGNGRTYYPAILAIVGIAIIAFALSNYDMNVKAATSSEDFTGIAIGVVGAVLLILALVWSGARTLRIDNTLQGVMLETAKTTSLVFIILLGAAMLTAAFRAFGGEELVREFLNSLPGGFWTKFIIVMAVIFILGFFLDFIEIAVVVVPIVAPILLADPSANITAVWLGVMIGLNIQTSFLTPPFGFALFYLRGVAPSSVRTLQIYKGVIPFILLQLLALGIVGATPQLVNYLPNRVSLLSDTAPPPRNPKFQYCLDEYASQQVADGEEAAALQRMRALDLAVLPDDMADDLSDALDSAETAIASLDDIDTTYGAVKDAAVEFRPKLANVRRIERDIRGLEDEAEELKVLIQRIRDPELADRKAELEARLEKDLADIEELRATIPESWKDDYAAFSKLINAELAARNTYRRNADSAYEDASEVLAVLRGNEAFAALKPDLEGLAQVIETATPEEGEALVEAVEDRLDEVEGTRDVKRSLSRARRALGDGNREDAMAEYQDALAAYAEQEQWRAEAATALRAPLEDYLSAIRGSLGVRVQNSLSREQALFLARCQSDHRDLSLNF